jgi:hypothetical protein
MRSPLVIVAVAAAAVALAASVVARGDIFRPGQYFGAYVAPGHGGHTGYSDGCSSWWIANKGVWSGGDSARVTYIDLSGGWHYTFKSSTTPVSREITLEQSKALGRTKLRCENASDFAVYYLACYSLSDTFTNCV